MVIASSNDGAILARCVDALAAQASSGDVEIIVVRDSTRVAGVDRAGILASAPGLQWIAAPPQSTVPRLRGLGMAASRGDLIAMLEDDCVVAADWCQAAVTTIGSNSALGGAVEPGPYRRALDWAVYFCEYGRFMLPLPSTPGPALTGNNVVYLRRALEALPEDSRREFREVFVHAAWHLAGIPTQVTGALVVHNINTWTWRHVTSGPFHHGRAYAAQRFSASSAMNRVAFSLMAIGLPLVKLLRITAGTLSRRRLTSRLIQAMPFMLVFVISWSAGEMLGCLRGPGTSPARWR